MQRDTQKWRTNKEKYKRRAYYSTTLRRTRKKPDYERYDATGENAEGKYNQNQQSQRRQATADKNQTSMAEEKTGTWGKQLKNHNVKNKLGTKLNK